ncbi:DUF4011 domain-containing protein [Sphingomicrobium nitratireducens]|uniref:DUF4011 domain-containing protein n=1 Tax=Sphingomicrobium nitratireducens TaxID=2964666 RepID=UPI002240D538|nr:DUF4011 domain-containing protein [Sphingomicrobium nitratireducens]
MSSRPYLNDSLQQLHERAQSAQNDAAQLDRILSELARRKTKGAQELRKSVYNRIDELESGGKVSSDWRPLSDGQLDMLELETEADAPQSGLSKPQRTQEPISPEDARRYRLAEEAIADLREKLLDLSRRNPLISFKHSTRAAGQLRIVDERIDKLFAALGRGAMGFEHLPGEDVTPADEKTHDFTMALERAKLTDVAYLKSIDDLADDEDDVVAWQAAERALRYRVREELGLPKIEYGKKVDVRSLAKAHGFDPSYELKDYDESDDAHHDDHNIRVLLTEKQLETRLKAIEQRYRSHQSQTGLHTLFLSFGFLEYPDDGAGDGTSLAPLFLMPVDLERQRKRQRYVFELTRRDDEPEINIALREKLRRPPYGIELPEMREEEEPSSYFSRVENVLEEAGRPNFRVRRFATLAVLPFPRMVLWRDLDPEIWDDHAFGKHDLLASLLAATDKLQGGGLQSDHDVESLEIKGEAPPLVCPADSSQHSIIVDAMKGTSLAVEGPPGTGKSQSITNVIAAALDRGKKVLFVAEKQAALDVVRERLEKMGFGPLLLDLHSENLTKKKVATDLRDRLAMSGGGWAEAESLRNRLKSSRDQIRTYLSLINKPLGVLGQRCFDLLWRRTSIVSLLDDRVVIQARQAIGSATAIALEKREYDAALSSLSKLSESWEDDEKLSGVQGNAWLRGGPLPPFNQTVQQDALKDAASALTEVSNQRQQICAKSGFRAPERLSDLRGWVNDFLELEVSERISEREFKAALIEEGLSRDLVEAQRQFQRLDTSLRDFHPTPSNIESDDVQSLAKAFEAFKPGKGVTLSDLESAIADLHRKLALLEDAQKAQGQIAKMGVDLRELDIESKEAVVSELLELADPDGQAAAFVTPALLSDAASTTATRIYEKAIELRAERDRLSQTGVRLSILDLTSNELEAQAEEIERTGWFGRLFSRNYRDLVNAARRHGMTGKREEMVTGLRAAAQFKASETRFIDDLAATSLVRAGNQITIDLDTAILPALVERAQSAWTKLVALDQASLVKGLLEASDIERRAIFAGLSSMSAAIEVLDVEQKQQAGFPDVKPEISAELDAKQSLHDCCRQIGLAPHTVLNSPAGQLDEQLSQLQQLNKKLEGAKPTVLAFFDGTDFDAAPLIDALQLVGVMSSDPTMQAANVLNVLREANTPLARVKECQGACAAIRDALSGFDDIAQQVLDVCAVQPLQYLTKNERLSSIEEQARSLSLIAADNDALRRAAALQSLLDEVAEGPASALIGMLKDGWIKAADLPRVFEGAIADALLDAYVGGEGKELARLSGLTMDRVRDEFRKVDRQLLEAEAQRIIAARLKDKAPSGNGAGPKYTWTQLSLIENEASKKARHVPIRDLTNRAAEALQVLKPLWMMSPGSVAQYVPPGAADFDLVIVDEASQMKPEFAVSAFMRGKQIMVVGDTKQLPPTDFFDGSADKDDDDGGMEVQQDSILELAEARLPGRRLSWHYRSQHEDLIAFSNRQFYDDSLVVFPSPRPEDPLLGVRHEHVGGIYRSSLNEEEARRVVEEAVSLMIQYPEESLGIATMNAKQADLIRNEMERLALEQKTVASYIDRWAGSLESFFVKNLENVQGDERDIILISTVYGPDENGTVAQRFGPINRPDGGRRLNVLASRAKKSMRVFTSLAPGNIKITPGSSDGLVAFHAFLTRVSGGAVEDDPTAQEKDFESDFERMVAERIQHHGYRVVPQVGVKGYRIDLGIKHKTLPLGYIAGVECDGATYHNAPSVRDRDQVRQSVLEGLGWNIHRIWSTDWWQDADRAMAKLLAQLETWSRELEDRWHREQALDSEGAPHLSEKDDTPSPTTADEPTSVGENRSSDVAKPAEVEVQSPSTSDEETAAINGVRRTLDTFDYVETSPHRMWVVVEGDERLGEVECLKRGGGSVQLYGGHTNVGLPEYEARPDGAAIRKFTDLYAALRYVNNKGKDKAA